jgi:galactose mutarotase-like enzyme
MDMTFEVITLATEELRVEVLPALGGRVQSLLDVVGDREWLWRNPELDTYACEVGDDYDSNWQGGFEELFPNDAATELDGRQLPDHGELWSACWDVVAQDSASVTLRTVGSASGVTIIKRFTVDGPTLTVDYTLDHAGDDATPLPYLFKMHPAVAVHRDCRLELPGGMIEAVDESFGTIMPKDGAMHPWPGPDGHDVGQCHDADSGEREFVYVHDVPEGWVGVHDARAGRRLRFEYPLEVFGWCWFFLSYGGWNDVHVAVLEPCTTHPKDLHAAIAAGTSPLLAPGESTHVQVRFSVAAA